MACETQGANNIWLMRHTCIRQCTIQRLSQKSGFRLASLQVGFLKIHRMLKNGDFTILSIWFETSFGWLCWWELWRLFWRLSYRGLQGPDENDELWPCLVLQVLPHGIPLPMTSNNRYWNTFPSCDCTSWMQQLTTSRHGFKTRWNLNPYWMFLRQLALFRKLFVSRNTMSWQEKIHLNPCHSLTPHTLAVSNNTLPFCHWTHSMLTSQWVWCQQKGVSSA